MKLIEFLLAKICLLKILLTSVPQAHPKNDLFPEDLLGPHFFDSKVGIYYGSLLSLRGFQRI